MTNVGFLNPDLLWLLPALLPLIVLWNFMQRQRDKRLARFAVRETWDVLNRSVSTRGRFHKALLLILALSFSIVAAARPYWGTREREVRKRGLNIIVAVDVSHSMLATDGAVVTRGRASTETPTRLHKARLAIQEFLALSQGHRVGILPFAGEAFLMCPLTTDYGILNDMLRELNVDVVGTQGTDIPDAINVAIKAFERSGDGRRVLIMVTDGETHNEAITNAAKAAKEKDISIYALGIGSIDGSPVIMPNGSFKEGPDNRKVISRLNPDILTTLADTTGGAAFVSAEDGTLNTKPLADMIASIARDELGEDKRKVPEERFQWPLGLALLCLLAEGFVSERKRQARAATTPAEGVRA